MGGGGIGDGGGGGGGDGDGGGGTTDGRGCDGGGGNSGDGGATVEAPAGSMPGGAGQSTVLFGVPAVEDDGSSNDQSMRISSISGSHSTPESPLLVERGGVAKRTGGCCASVSAFASAVPSSGATSKPASPPAAAAPHG